MTDDLVKRLRCYADIDDAVYHPWVYGEAADRIEKLEAALRSIDEWAEEHCMVGLRKLINKALEGKDE